MRLIFSLFCFSLIVAGIPSMSCAGFDERVAELKSLAQQGDAAAQYKLGSWYDVGYLQPYSEAVKWYRLAADQGNTHSMTSLGALYAEGTAVTQDYREAVRWYRKAADQGDAAGQELLARCYRDGHGVPQDNGEAAIWYRKAASQGYASAQWHLGKVLS